MVQARDVPEDAEGRARVKAAACGLRSPRLIAYLLIKPTCAGLAGHSVLHFLCSWYGGVRGRKGAPRAQLSFTGWHPTA